MYPDPVLRLRLRHRSPQRAGVVLIIIVGLSMILLGLAVTFMMRMRSDSSDTAVIVAEAQSRIMLHAALMYLSESSRLGWVGETCGWTDLRDGGLGPRGPRNYLFKTLKTGGITTTPVTGAIDGRSSDVAAPFEFNIPPPIWWKSTWPTYRAIPDDASPVQFPTSAERVWPCPGSIGRFPMAVPEQPPYATQLRYAGNPVSWPAGSTPYGQPGSDTPWASAPHINNNISIAPGWAGWLVNPGESQTTYVDWPKTWADDIFDPNRGSIGMLDPQPQADVFYNAFYTGAAGQRPDFVHGKILPPGSPNTDWTHKFPDPASPGTFQTVSLSVMDGTENVCWFRIYREVQADHDSDGTPSYDRVAMYDRRNPDYKNWNVFVITCGSGGARGFRFWDEPDVTRWEMANGYPLGFSVSRGQEFASNSPVFASLGRASFNDMMAASKMVWYRVEWTAMQGGGFVPERYQWGGAEDLFWGAWTNKHFPDYQKGTHYWDWWLTENTNFTQNIEGGYASQGLRFGAPKTYAGGFKWVQRLDHEPPNW